jgi:CHAD domain-containing protein
MGSVKRYYEDYAANAIERYLLEIERQAPAIIAEQDDIEPLHQTRIAARSLRNALWAFKNLFPKSQLVLWQKNLKNITRISGQARALDGFIFFLKDFGKKRSSRYHAETLNLLIQKLQEERTALQPKMREAINDVAFQRTLKDIGDFITTLRQLEKKKELETLQKVGKKKILKRLAEVLSYEIYVSRPERIDELHQMRISAKHLRYILEDLADFYGPSISYYINQARTIQKFLGEMHDFDERIMVLNRYLRGKHFDDFHQKTIRVLRAECKKRRDLAYQRFFKFWQILRQQQTWEKLNHFIDSYQTQERA